MGIPKNITRSDIINAINEIDKEGVPENRRARWYYLNYFDKFYPPKYVISIANKYANGRQLPADEFNGGKPTNGYLTRRGFKVIRKTREYI